MSASPPLRLPDPLPERESPQDSVDTLIQNLFAAHLIVEGLPSALERSPATAREGLDELQRIIKRTLGDVYSLQRQLHAGALKTLRGAELLRHLAAHGTEDGHSDPAEAA
jgi:signal transduction histidine kinase